MTKKKKTNLQLYSWVAFCRQWETVSFIQATGSNIWPQLCCEITVLRHRRAPAASSRYAKTLSLCGSGVHLLSSPLLICRHFVKVAGAKKTKTKQKIKQRKGRLSYLSCWNSTHCLTVTSLILFLLCWKMSLGSLGLFVFIVNPPRPQPLLSLYFLPSYTVGRFCSVWNMIL